MSAAIGTFFSGSSLFSAPRVIPLPKAPAPPPPRAPSIPLSRMPAPTGPVIGDPIITPVTVFTMPVLKAAPTGTGDAPPAAPAPDAPPANTGTSSQGPTGGGGTNDLLGAMSQLFQPTAVQSSPLATVQYAPTGADGSLDGSSSSSSGISPAVIIVLLLVIGGGIYMLKKRAAK